MGAATKSRSNSRARLNPRHQDMVREKIRASMLVNRLQDCATGKVDMTPAQVTAARALLDKCVSNAPTNVNLGGGLKLEVNLVGVDRSTHR